MHFILFSSSPDLSKPHLASTWKPAQICCGLSIVPVVWVNTVNRHTIGGEVNVSITVYSVLLIAPGLHIQLDSICWRAGTLWQRRHEFWKINVFWRRMSGIADGCYSCSDWQLGCFFHFVTACGHNVLAVSNMGLMSVLCLPWMGIQTQRLPLWWLLSCYLLHRLQAGKHSLYPLFLSCLIFLAKSLQPHCVCHRFNVNKNPLAKHSKHHRCHTISLQSLNTYETFGSWLTVVCDFSCRVQVVFGVCVPPSLSCVVFRHSCLTTVQTHTLFHMSTHCRGPAHTPINTCCIHYTSLYITHSLSNTFELCYSACVTVYLIYE